MKQEKAWNFNLRFLTGGQAKGLSLQGYSGGSGGFRWFRCRRSDMFHNLFEGYQKYKFDASILKVTATKDFLLLLILSFQPQLFLSLKLHVTKWLLQIRIGSITLSVSWSLYSVIINVTKYTIVNNTWWCLKYCTLIVASDYSKKNMFDSHVILNTNKWIALKHRIRIMVSYKLSKSLKMLNPWLPTCFTPQTCKCRHTLLCSMQWNIRSLLEIMGTWILKQNC